MASFTNMTTEQVGNKPNQNKTEDKGLSVAQAFKFAWEMGYTMAIPLVVLAIGGRLLDKHFNTSPMLLLTGIMISIVLSSILVGLKAVSIISRVSGESEQRNK